MKEHYINIGKTATIRIEGLSFQVRLTDVKMAYGQVRYQITPISGTGQKWVNRDSVTIKD